MTTDLTKLEPEFVIAAMRLLEEHRVHDVRWNNSIESDRCILSIFKETEYDNGFDIHVSVMDQNIEITASVVDMARPVAHRVYGNTVDDVVVKTIDLLRDMLTSVVYIHEYIDNRGFVQTHLVRRSSGSVDVLPGSEGNPCPPNYKIKHEYRMNHFMRGGRPKSY